MNEASRWHDFDQRQSIGTPGSEGGVTMRDEEHEDGARITLERDASTAPFAITCGLYGWFFHTCFLSSQSEAQITFDKMKIEMQIIIKLVQNFASNNERNDTPILDAISEFIDRFHN